MSRNLGVPGGAEPPPPSSVAPPAAVRAAGPGWRDPRLWIGVVIVAASVLVGARVLASADDTVQVWGLAVDVAPGQRLTEADLEPHRVRFAEDDVRERYFVVDEELPEVLTPTRGLGAGELLPRAALGDSDDTDEVEVSIEVSPGLMPTSVGPGSVVDVFLVATGGRRTDAGPALSEVRVVDTPVSDDGLAPAGLRQVVLAVDPGDVEGFYSALGSLDAPVVYVAGHAG